MMLEHGMWCSELFAKILACNALFTVSVNTCRYRMHTGYKDKNCAKGEKPLTFLALSAFID